MTRKVTITTPEAPGAEGANAVGTLDAEQALAAAVDALEGTTQRIAELDGQIAEASEHLAVLGEQEARAPDEAHEIARQLHALPGQIAAARARVLALTGQPGQEPAVRSVEELRVRLDALTQQDVAARSTAETTLAQIASERERMVHAQADAQRERDDLVELLPHLHQLVAEARTAAGAALVDVLQAERSELEATRAAAQTQLDQAQAALSAFEDRARAALAAYPQALADAQGMSLLPRQVTRVEQAVEAKLTLLRLLQRGGLEAQAIDRQPLWAILTDQRGFPEAVDGRNDAYFADRLQATESWLSSFRQFYRAQRS